MTQFLPPNLLALFAPREPIPFLPPPDKLPHEKKNVHNYEGVAAYLARADFEDPADTPPTVKVETRDERLERKRREKEEQVAYKLEQEIAMWDPTSNDDATADPFKTLYIGRINYYTTESKIRREFETYGPIKKIHMVHDQKSGKPRGYCFIEYEHERDMHSAYKKADGMKIDGRRVLVDVERSRTVKGWLPRRLGGGIGGTRLGGADVNVHHSGRADGPGHRERSRDRSRDRDRERDRERRRSPRGSGGGDRDRRDSRRERDSRRRSRSKSKDRKRSRRSRSKERKRSRSKDRKRSRRSRSKERSSRKDRKRDLMGAGGGAEEVRVKDEPEDHYDEGEYGYENMQIKQEDMKPMHHGAAGNGDDYPDDQY